MPRTQRGATRRPQRPETDPFSAAFFEALESSGHVPRGVSAPEAAAGVLGLVLLRVSAEDAAAFVESLPESLRALLRPFATDRPRTSVLFDRDGFLDLVAQQFEIARDRALRLSRVVFAALEYELPVEEPVHHVEEKLPIGLRELWRQDTRGA
jgi:uncharacterized protein (DUF2267 family)